jgi:hypothetical protein
MFLQSIVVSKMFKQLFANIGDDAPVIVLRCLTYCLQSQVTFGRSVNLYFIRRLKKCIRR